MSGLVGALLLATPATPVALAALWLHPRTQPWGVRAAPWAAAPGLLLALLAFGGDDPGLVLALDGVLLGARLVIDPLARAFLLLTAALWLVGGAFARTYHRTDPRQATFFLFFVLTMAGNLGLVVAGDIVTFYVFFTAMTFAAYGLVVHRRDPEAMRAGRIYVVLSLLGEVILLAGLLTLAAATVGHPAFGTGVAVAWNGLAEAPPFAGAVPVVALLIAAGFGVKAGLVPLHMWLPLAHPVAPTAASALLSGVMIKAGLLGWLRMLPAEIPLAGPGVALIAVGVVTAGYGVVVGLSQDDPKTVLAYSSVSQMGSMAIAAGLLLFGGRELAGAAVTAAVLYAVHHGVAKGALFLTVGVADRVPASGGRRLDRWILAGAALPALALAGAPLTTGALAKNALKADLAMLGSGLYGVLDPALVVAAFGTTLLLFRFFVTLHRRMEGRGEGDGIPEASRAGGGAGPLRAREPPSADEVRGWVGLAAPWVVLLAAGVAGVVWLPHTFSELPGVDPPRVVDGALSALLPVLAGVLTGWAVLRRGRGTPARLRIPAGDLVVPLERALARVRTPGPEGIRRAITGIRRRLRALEEGWIRVASALARGDSRWLAGPGLGAAFFGVTVLVALALLAGR